MCTIKLFFICAVLICSKSLTSVTGTKFIPNGTKTVYNNGETHVITKFIIVPDEFNEKVLENKDSQHTLRYTLLNQTVIDAPSKGKYIPKVRSIKQDNLKNDSKYLNKGGNGYNNERHDLNNDAEILTNTFGHDNHTSETQTSDLIDNSHINTKANVKKNVKTYVTYKTNKNSISSDFQDSHNSIKISDSSNDHQNVSNIYRLINSIQLPVKWKSTYNITKRQYKNIGTEKKRGEQMRGLANEIIGHEDDIDIHKEINNNDKTNYDIYLSANKYEIPENDGNYSKSVSIPANEVTSSTIEDSADGEKTENTIRKYNKLSKVAYNIDIKFNHQKNDNASEDVAALQPRVNMIDSEPNRNVEPVPSAIAHNDDLASLSSFFIASNYKPSTEIYTDQKDLLQKTTLSETSSAKVFINVTNDPNEMNNIRNDIHILETTKYLDHGADTILKNITTNKTDRETEKQSSELSEHSKLTKFKENKLNDYMNTFTKTVPDANAIKNIDLRSNMYNYITNTNNPVFWNTETLMETPISSNVDKHIEDQSISTISKSLISNNNAALNNSFDVDNYNIYNIHSKLNGVHTANNLKSGKYRTSLDYYNTSDDDDYTYPEDLTVNTKQNLNYLTSEIPHTKQYINNIFDSNHAHSNTLKESYIKDVSNDIKYYLIKNTILEQLDINNLVRNQKDNSNNCLPAQTQNGHDGSFALPIWFAIHKLMIKPYPLMTHKSDANSNNQISSNNNFQNQVVNDKILEYIVRKSTVNSNIVGNPFKNVINPNKVNKNPILEKYVSDAVNRNHGNNLNDYDMYKVNAMRRANVEHKFNLIALKDFLKQMFLYTKVDNIENVKMLYNNVLNYVMYLFNNGVHDLIIKQVIGNVERRVYGVLMMPYNNLAVCNY